MKRHTILFPASFAAVFVGALVVGTLSTSAVARAGDDKPCSTKSFKFPAVEKACKKGGQTEVKTLMKAAVKKAKDAGQDVNCKSCHSDLKAFDLKANAVADLKKWI